MSEEGKRRMDRAGGILLPISSLPSRYGFGTLGAEAYRFADFLKAAGQKYWQILPLGPTGFGDSPYQSFSAYAGNPYMIDLELLIEDGLLRRDEVERENWGTETRYVDYGQIYAHRFAVLHRAFERGWRRDHEQVEFFAQKHHWLADYALFMACKRHFGMRAWQEWPDEALRLHRPEAVAAYREKLREDVEFFTYLQYLFDRQWTALRSYIHAQGIAVIGDVPIYVAMDSADVWAERQFFQLDERGYPIEVSGVPPDYFSEDGQLWGNPLYRWDVMEQDGYGWWIRRIDGAGARYDVIRIDHFRGLDEYWAVPYGAATAKIGTWCKGPGMALIAVLKGWFPQLRFIAEDLGILSPSVGELLHESGWPGMKVLSFAFNPDGQSSYLPHNHIETSICYTGTHDNSPLPLWQEEAAAEELAFARRYLGIGAQQEIYPALLRWGMAGAAQLFVAQMQDYLGLGKYHRINTPGTAVGNWQWRLLPGEASAELAERIRAEMILYGRASPIE